jgi:peptide/nickel transport system permease protein
VTAVQAATFLARRLGALIVLLFVISIAVFALQDLAPGGPERALLRDLPATQATVHAIRQKYHLDDPFLVQYGYWARGAVRLDFGNSIWTGQNTTEAIAEHLGVTLFLVIYALVIAMSLGVGLGILAGLLPSSPLDRIAVAIGVVGASSPAFVLSIFLLYLFGVVFHLFPVFGEGAEGDFLDQLAHMTLPALALALTSMALIIKLTRAGVIAVAEQDYVAFARARGLGEWHVLLAYVIRNALNPVISSAGLTFTRMLFGTVLVEVTFGLPGLGNLLVTSVNVRDIPMMQALALLIAAVVVVVNLCMDTLYFLVDPRVRLTRMAA